jgi:HD-like signal output (HDOD) protein
MSITDAEIVKAASSLGLLGGSSLTAHRILASLCDASLGTREIVGLIEHEPGLAARVLKVANSAYYGQSRNIATLDRALLILGLDAVRGITAAACLDRSISRRSNIAGMDPRTLVNHCVASAFAAEQLARRSGRSSAAESFMAALLHDFGVPVQERLDAEGIEKLISALREDENADPSALEQKLVKVTHTHCSQVIFESWNMPPSIVMAARHHENPAQAPGPARELTTLVHLGIQIAIEAGFTYPMKPRQLRQPRELLLRSVGLDESVVEEIAPGLAERVLLMVEGAAA